ncbi:MAG: hypothetical protein ACOYUZ_02180 [Patescibacteria group bacterium]
MFIMDNAKSLSRYILVVLCVSVVFTAIILVALNAYVQNKRISQGDNGFLETAFETLTYEDGYRKGYEEARKEFSTIPDEIFTLTGAVTITDDANIYFIPQNTGTNEFVDGIPETRIAELAEDTKIYKRAPLTTEELDKALADWRRSGAEGNPPAPFVDEELTINEIAAGQTISVTADTNIKELESFIAKEIILIQE